MFPTTKIPSFSSTPSHPPPACLLVEILLLSPPSSFLPSLSLISLSLPFSLTPSLPPYPSPATPPFPWKKLSFKFPTTKSITDLMYILVFYLLGNRVPAPKLHRRETQICSYQYAPTLRGQIRSSNWEMLPELPQFLGSIWKCWAMRHCCIRRRNLV